MGGNSSKSGGSVKGAGKLIAALRAAETHEAVLRLATAAGERGELSPAAASAALQRLAALLPRGGAALRGDGRFTALCSLLTRQPAGVRPRTLANVLYAFGALAAAPDADWLRRAEAAAASALPEMSAEDAANVIWGLTVCGHRPNAKWLAAWTAVWHSRLAEASEAGASVHPQAVERALWACGTLQHNPGAEVLAQSATAAAAVARAAAPSALAHTLWALAALRTPPPPGAAADLAAAAAAKFAAATPGELVTIFWAISSLGRDPGSPWYEAFEAAAAQHGGALDAGSRATILWSYATIRRHPGAAALAGHANAWLAALESSASEAASDTAAAALEKAMWACASLRYVPGGPWMARVARVALPRLSRFDANGLATLLWSFASMGASPGAELLARAADVWTTRLAEAPPPPQAVANTLWAFATLNYHPGEPWLDAVAAATRARLLEFPAAALASCVWAYGSLAHAPPGGWLPAAADAVARRLHELDAETLSQAVWGFATLSFHPGRPWLDAFGRAATAALGPDKPPASGVALTNMLFGLMVLREHAAAAGGPARSATGVAWAALAAAADAGAVGEAALRILMTADLLLDSEAPELAGALPPPAGGAAGGTTRALWRQRARMAWADSVRAAAAAQAATHHQRDVCRALTALKLQHTPGLLVERDGLPVIAIDAALTCRGGGRAALQADGASAFVRNSKQPTGSTLLRDRLYETLGWRVVMLPGHAWPRATESRTAYLEKVLRDVKGIL